MAQVFRGQTSSMSSNQVTNSDKIVKEIQCTDLNLWPDLVFSSTTARLLKEGVTLSIFMFNHFIVDSFILNPFTSLCIYKSVPKLY